VRHDFRDAGGNKHVAKSRAEGVEKLGLHNLRHCCCTGSASVAVWVGLSKTSGKGQG
jgi:hypothetical protein